MILSPLTYLHIKALIKISKEGSAYFKINSEGETCVASRDVVFLIFVCVVYMIEPIFFFFFLINVSSG